MDSVMYRELKLICDQIDLSDDGEGANVSGTKPLAGQAHPDISGGQPNLLSGLEDWSIGPLGIGLDFFCVALPAKADGMLHPRPSHSLRTNSQHPMVSRAMGTKEVTE